MSPVKTASLTRYMDSTNQKFFNLYTDWFRQMKYRLRELDLTHPQFQILATVHGLSLQNTEITQIMVAKAADVDAMTASAIITKLSREDLLDRYPGKKNPRSKALSLTQAGEEKLQQALDIVNQFDQDLWSQFDAALPESIDQAQAVVKTHHF
ncbi:DNA-binding transcriptional regulator [Fructobacillus tropaeoli]|uniref:MarR family winged helix-turn-helix transcriptional regulator n=1 Tax=Fructobacillus tropaeoli TaxID=709323 RepID=UPI001455F852|nr:MarR family transcriptional regulator [Fructobacillus tropaeoli]NLS37861.1 winged helix DNA-binding protein [Fructobacillus tropaeoli]CAK1223623.1 DNA-binding transcriptional regulator [Fructobacillus tropaeoli]CAK1235769.1 DNA-binding transcriptional regulator [Fructobacillus tropaeoli]